MSCNYCGENPCIVSLYCDEAIQQGRQEAENCGEHNNSSRRHHAYHGFVHLWIGYTGHGNHVEIPECVVDYIHAAFPDDTGKGYMGHRHE